ncbi:MAG: hypothetical protein ACK5II_04335 [Paracoccus sp. (in: a-proteobacteria)]
MMIVEKNTSSPSDAEAAREVLEQMYAYYEYEPLPVDVPLAEAA